MKTIVYAAIISLLGSLIALNCYAQYHTELSALSRIDLLPEYVENSEVWQVSSYDTTGGNDDGFSGKYSFIRKEEGGLVIADLKGPGIIQRIWTPTPTNDTMQFFFDGEKDPRISLPFIDLFSGKEYPFLRPVVGNEIGGYYCYIPIPYKSSCKILLKGERMQFIQIQYRKKTGSETLESYPREFSTKEKDALEIALKIWNSSGSDVLKIYSSQGEIYPYAASVKIKPGESVEFLKMKKGGRILGIEIVPHTALNKDFKDLLLQAFWDEEGIPAINCPVSDFFGYAYGKPSMQSMLCGVNAGVHYCYFPMPFSEKASMELVYLDNPDAVPISADIRIFFSYDKISENEGRFYAKWKREIDPELGKPYTILDITGRGHHVVTILQSQGLNHGMTIFFEGDDICTIDGIERLHGTGSEDYFNGGWYAIPDRWDNAFSLPVHGCLDYSIPLARTGGYRHLISDKINFEKSYNLTIEHGPVDNNTHVDYTSVACYYSDTPPDNNNIEDMDLLKAVKSPDLMEYYIQMLPVDALSSNASLSKPVVVNSLDEGNYRVFKLQADNGGYAKFRLQVPSEGDYKLYLSYFKGPDCSSFAVNQRQIPLKTLIPAYSENYTLVEKEFIGTMKVREGTNTITVVLKEKPESIESGSICLFRAYLEKCI